MFSPGYRDSALGRSSGYSVQDQRGGPQATAAVLEEGAPMNQRDIAQQTLLEQNLLTNITQAIRTTIAWEPRGNDLGGKLRSLRFITASLERHLDHRDGSRRVRRLHDGRTRIRVRTWPRRFGV